METFLICFIALSFGSIFLMMIIGAIVHRRRGPYRNFSQPQGKKHDILDDVGDVILVSALLDHDCDD